MRHWTIIEWGLIGSLIAVVIITGLRMGVKTTITLHAKTPCAYPAYFAEQVNMLVCSATITKGPNP